MRLAAAVAALALALVAFAPAHARADGVYISESHGPGFVHEQLGSDLSSATFRVKLALGVRFGNWALEPFVASESTNPGGNDYDSQKLTSYGVDLKRVMRVSKHASVYVRGSMSHLAFPDQPPCCVLEPLYLPASSLYGYSGRGLGVGVGAQYAGRIPLIGLRGGVFVEDSYDYYRLLAPYEPYDYARLQIDGSITRFTIGFAIGSDF